MTSELLERVRALGGDVVPARGRLRYRLPDTPSGRALLAELRRERWTQDFRRWFHERVGIYDRSHAAVWRLREDFIAWCGVHRDCDLEVFEALLRDEAGVAMETVAGRTWARGIILTEFLPKRPVPMNHKTRASEGSTS